MLKLIMYMIFAMFIEYKYLSERYIYFIVCLHVMSVKTSEINGRSLEP